jgi:voltage-gated potassium channel
MFFGALSEVHSGVVVRGGKRWSGRVLLLRWGRGRVLRAEDLERLWRWPMTVATLLVIPDLLMTGPVAGAIDWVIWVVFAAELFTITFMASDGRAWLRRNPIALAVTVLTPPVVPAALQGLRVVRLLRLLRLARGWQYINRVFTPEGLPYLIGLGVVLIFAGSALFSSVETHAHNHVSLTDGLWWAIGVISTEGSSINASTMAGHIITVVLMVLGIALFSMITAGLTQHFVGQRQKQQEERISSGEQAILDELKALRTRLELLEGRRGALSTAAERSPARS